MLEETYIYFLFISFWYNSHYFINLYSLFQLFHIVLVTFCLSRQNGMVISRRNGTNSTQKHKDDDASQNKSWYTNYSYTWGIVCTTLRWLDMKNLVSSFLPSHCSILRISCCLLITTPYVTKTVKLQYVWITFSMRQVGGRVWRLRITACECLVEFQ